MFIGYPRSSHSLVGAILGAHPEIIIPHQYDVIKYWNKYRPSTTRKTKMSKYHLFYDLHQLSREQCLEFVLSIQTGRWEAIAITYQARGKEVIKRE